MARYFEANNPGDGSVVIDDTLTCLELRGAFPLSEFHRFAGSAYTMPSYSKNHNLGKRIFWGFGLDGLAGKSFCPYVRSSDGYVAVEFRNPNAQDFRRDRILRDDIAASAKLYAFSLDARAPTEHMTGVEIYNERGQVTYSSAYGHLHVLACDCLTPVTVSYGGTGVVFILGEDVAFDYYVSHRRGMVGAEYAIYPQITVTGNSVTIQKITRQTMYADSDMGSIMDDPECEHHYASWHTYGWLVGEVI